MNLSQVLPVMAVVGHLEWWLPSSWLQQRGKVRAACSIEPGGNSSQGQVAASPLLNRGRNSLGATASTQARAVAPNIPVFSGVGRNPALPGTAAATQTTTARKKSRGGGMLPAPLSRQEPCPQGMQLQLP